MKRPDGRSQHGASSAGFEQRYRVIEDTDRVERVFEYIEDENRAEGSRLRKDLHLFGALKVSGEIDIETFLQIGAEVAEAGLLDELAGGLTAIADAEFQDGTFKKTSRQQSLNPFSIVVCHEGIFEENDRSANGVKVEGVTSAECDLESCHQGG